MAPRATAIRTRMPPGTESLTIIHNGIIENYGIIKETLTHKGHIFKSDTDTEVLIHLVEDIQNETGLNLREAVRIALTKVIGAYAIVIMSEDEPDLLIAARKGSPMVIGVGKGEYFIASDATPIVEYTKNVIYLNDNEVAYVTRENLLIKNINNKVQTPYIQELDLKLEMLEKGGYDHFMLKEIYEQPLSIRDCMRGRIYPRQGKVQLGGIKGIYGKAEKYRPHHYRGLRYFVACRARWRIPDRRICPCTG